MRTLILAALIAGSAAPAIAQDCPRVPGWNKPQRHIAARSADMRFALKTGSAVQLGLRPRRDVRLATPAPRQADARSFAGLAALDVPRAGKLELVLSNRSYVDLVRDGRALRSTAHSDPRNCAGVRKVVVFDVKPGRYIVQLSNAPERAVRMAAVLR